MITPEKFTKLYQGYVLSGSTRNKWLVTKGSSVILESVSWSGTLKVPACSGEN